MTVYTTILANYLFWIAQYTMIFLWSPRNWQCVGMWVVQGNKLKADNSGLLYEAVAVSVPLHWLLSTALCYERPPQQTIAITSVSS